MSHLLDRLPNWKAGRNSDARDDFVVSAPLSFTHTAHGESALAALAGSKKDEDLQDEQELNQHQDGVEQNTQKKAVVLWEFKAQMEGELTLAAGSEVSVYRFQDETGDQDWWEGQDLTTGANGWFPSSRVKILA